MFVRIEERIISRDRVTEQGNAFFDQETVARFLCSENSLSPVCWSSVKRDEQHKFCECTDNYRGRRFQSSLESRFRRRSFRAWWIRGRSNPTLSWLLSCSSLRLLRQLRVISPLRRSQELLLIRPGEDRRVEGTSSRLPWVPTPQSCKRSTTSRK